MKLRIPTAVAAAVAVSAIAAGGGQAADGRTVTFLDNIDRGKQAFVDNPPKSPDQNPASKRFRLSTGDMVYVRSPILDRKGGSRIGTAYSQFTVVSGSRFSNVVFRGHGAFKLRDGQLAVDGVVRPANSINTIPVVGGTGAYEGARGSMTFREVAGGSQDTFHLLP